MLLGSGHGEKVQEREAPVHAGDAILTYVNRYPPIAGEIHLPALGLESKHHRNV
jgi:hypothetical protein